MVIALLGLLIRVANSGAALLAVIGSAALLAHHSISVIDTSAPEWLKGRVMRYEAQHPHVLIHLEVTNSDTSAARDPQRHWSIEGPSLARLARMNLPKDFLKIGDVIEVCGFNPKPQFWNERNGAKAGLARNHIHGQLLIFANGAMRPWGPYGKLDNCLRDSDQLTLWLQLLNTNDMAREYWCNAQRMTLVPSVAPMAQVEQINRALNKPCARG